MKYVYRIGNIGIGFFWLHQYRISVNTKKPISVHLYYPQYIASYSYGTITTNTSWLQWYPYAI